MYWFLIWGAVGLVIGGCQVIFSGYWMHRKTKFWYPVGAFLTGAVVGGLMFSFIGQPLWGDQPTNKLVATDKLVLINGKYAIKTVENGKTAYNFAFKDRRGVVHYATESSAKPGPPALTCYKHAEPQNWRWQPFTSGPSWTTCSLHLPLDNNGG